MLPVAENIFLKTCWQAGIPNYVSQTTDTGFTSSLGQRSAIYGNILTLEHVTPSLPSNE